MEKGRDENIVVAAEQSKAIYDEFIQAGFSEDQSFILLRDMFKTELGKK